MAYTSLLETQVSPESSYEKFRVALNICYGNETYVLSIPRAVPPKYLDLLPIFVVLPHSIDFIVQGTLAHAQRVARKIAFTK